ncbi:MAG: AI-2E family transporter [Clostridiales bacterium]|nr:AI-2E family transporter [Clostridiales bacterium]
MKLDRNDKYFTIAVYSLIVVLACIILVFLCINDSLSSALSRISAALSPVVYGLVFAYLFKPIVVFLDSKVLKFIKPIRIKRLISIITTFVFVLSLISLFLWIIVPQLISSVSELQSMLGDFIGRANEWIDKNSANASDTLKYVFSLASNALNSVLDTISNYIGNSLPAVGSFLSAVIVVLGQSSLGFLFSALFLFSYEFFGLSAKKILLSIFKRERYDRILKTCSKIDTSFGGYLRGVILNAIAVGIVTFIFLAIFNVQYAPLLGLIMGVANMIPAFGAIIGAIPAGLIILVSQPDKLIWFIIIVVAVQLLDGNILAPKLMGTNIGLSSELVLVAIILMSGLWGITGMLLGVPIFAVAYSLIGDWARNRLQKKELSTELRDYCSEEDYELISESARCAEEKKLKKAQSKT